MTATTEWHPPSRILEKDDGIWRPRSVSAVSYPQEGNDVCFQIEDGSYWFAHRKACILTVVRRLPPPGMFYDIGGGNGFVALPLQNAGIDVALLEPGAGARNARTRGVRHIIHAALEDAGFEPGSLPSAGAFDVIEHIKDDDAFLRAIHRHLQPGGRFYCTVPAGKLLWSGEDVHAGHFRRHTTATVRDTLSAAGFEVEFVSAFFSWLVPLVFFFRALPFRVRGDRPTKHGDVQVVKGDHSLPTLLRGPVGAIHKWELSRLDRLKAIPVGTSLLAVARAKPR